MHPFTDIVVLVHNRLNVTKQFVDRLFSFTKNFNLIFVDNGSTDDTPIFLDEGEKQNKWTVIRHPANLGVIRGRNSALKLIKSEYFLNIDNDQLVTEGWLEKLHNCMSQGFDIVGTEAWKMSPPRIGGQVIIDGRIGPKDMSYFPHRKCLRISESFTYLGCGGMLIKRHICDKIGLFDDRFSPAYFEDPDFCFRVIRAGFKLGWCFDCKIEHLAHQTISAQSLFDKNKQFIQSWDRFKEKWKPYFPQPIKMNHA